MVLDLFTKPTDSITFTDIELFFNAQIGENIRIDYKKDFPNDLGKCISEFANTYGGIILIGIEANKTTNIPTKMEGVDLINGLEEKIISISHANIYPPITPEVRICPFKSNQNLTTNDKAIILIRVEESYDAPHMYIKKRDNRYYVRVHNKSEIAEPLKIEDLFIKRKKGEEKFEEIIKEKIAIRRHADYRMVYIVPASPIKSVIHFNKDMDTFIKSIEPNTLRFGDYQPIRDGGYYEYKSEFSVEITKEGLICYRENWRQRDSTNEMKGDIMIDTSIVMLFQILRYAKKIYEKIGFYGNVIIGAEIYGTENKVLFTTPNRILSEEYSTTAKSVLVNQRFSYSEFENIYHATYTIIEILLRSFKLVLDEKVLSEWIITLMTTVKE